MPYLRRARLRIRWISRPSRRTYLSDNVRLGESLASSAISSSDRPGCTGASDIFLVSIISPDDVFRTVSFLPLLTGFCTIGADSSPATCLTNSGSIGTPFSISRFRSASDSGLLSDCLANLASRPLLDLLYWLISSSSLFDTSSFLPPAITSRIIA